MKKQITADLIRASAFVPGRRSVDQNSGEAF